MRHVHEALSPLRLRSIHAEGCWLVGGCMLWHVFASACVGAVHLCWKGYVGPVRFACLGCPVCVAWAGWPGASTAVPSPVARWHTCLHRCFIPLCLPVQQPVCVTVAGTTRTRMIFKTPSTMIDCTDEGCPFAACAHVMLCHTLCWVYKMKHTHTHTGASPRDQHSVGPPAPSLPALHPASHGQLQWAVLGWEGGGCGVGGCMGMMRFDTASTESWCRVSRAPV